MKANDWLKAAELQLRDIPTAHLDALVLLEDALEKDRGWLLAHPEYEVDDKIAKKLQLLLGRRASHEPLAYIRGKTEFYGREFIVNKHVLEPRPESEIMIDLLKNLDLREAELVIIDVGTGSGCLAITAKYELPSVQVYATDISPGGLKISKQNAKNHTVEINFLEGNLLQPLSEIRDLKFETTILLCNLPYVPDGHIINEAAMHEPRLAIFGGKDGLDLYRMMFKQMDSFKTTPLFILTESLPSQHKKLTALARAHGYKEYINKGFIQIFSWQDLRRGYSLDQ